MAEHVLETRIQLRYDTYSNWMASTVILKPGEMAIAVIPFNTSITSSDTTPANTPPAIGLKVGDGYSYFSELPWVLGIAGDVYNWAKAAVKPTYTAGEIEGLQAFIELYGGGGGSGSGSGSDTPVVSRVYLLVQGTGANANKFYLQYRTSDSDIWITDTSRYIDLSPYKKILDWIGEDINEYFSLNGRIFTTVYELFLTKNYSDSPENGKVVSAVSQNNGLISVTKKTLNFNEIDGTINISLGGTGISAIGEDQILVGNAYGIFTTRTIDTILESNTNLATNAAIKDYIDAKTAGLVGAMHYIGESSVEINPSVNAYVDPNIYGYNFRNVQAGDVVTYNQKEFVWSGGWRLLGDEGSYAVKGSIVNADISPEAAISQNKIANLVETLSSKVDAVEGKLLSTNDYTTIEKNKLAEIENGAQVNAIEHIFVNDTERPIVTINGLEKSISLSIDVFDEEHSAKLDGIQAGAQVNVIEHIFVNGTEQFPITFNNNPKSVNLVFNPFTDAEKLKLLGIEAEALVNTIEKIVINNTNEFLPNSLKEIHLTIDAAALNLTVVEGAQVPNGNDVEDVVISLNNKKLQLARIAKTGNIKDVLQNNEEYVTLYCGTSVDVI